MKILIAYASRSGTTASCAQLLSDQLTQRGAHEVELCNLDRGGSPTLTLAEYDFVALGSPVRYGKLLPAVRSFMDKNASVLRSLRAGYFICCGYTDSAPEYLHKLIPPELAHTAVTVASFGGVVNVAKLRGLDRLMARMMIGAITDAGEEEGLVKVAHLPEINPDSISRFADAIKLSFRK